VIVFSVKNWGAWAPGLEQPENWLRWAAGVASIAAEGEPKALAMPPMLRRRAGRQVRMAFEAAHACVQGRKNIPVVFCSRHGEVRRSIEILEPLARDEAISPAAFSLSVHNAISGLYSIAAADTAPMTALAGGADGAAQGLIEACAQVAAGAAEVLLVVYDEPLPAVYQAYRDTPETAFAWAWLITAPQDKAYAWSWSRQAPSEAANEEQTEVFGLRMLRCLLSETEQQTLAGQGKQWHWRRHA